MAKIMTSVRIDDEIFKEAKKKKINISQAAEDMVLKRINQEEMQETAEYPDELAKEDPDNYFIDLFTGKCKKRSEPIFFINEAGGVARVGKEEYMFRKGMLGKDTAKEEKKEPIKKPALFLE